VTARREFGAAIVLCAVGSGLVLLTLRETWARVYYHAPAPLPSGSVAVSGQSLLASAEALAIASLACLAAVIATRGVARRVAGALMAGLGVWTVVVVSATINAAGVIAAASASGSSGGFAGTGPEGNPAISGNASSGSGGLPVIGAATKVALASGPWRAAAVAGAVIVIVAGLAAAWHGPRWPVMSARFDRPGQQPAGAAGAAPVSQAAAAPAPGTPDGAPAGTVPPIGADGATQPAGAEPRHPDGDAAALWEALDRGVDLTDSDAPAAPAPEAGAPKAGAPKAGAPKAGPDAASQPVAARGDEH
jgi:uncharacterized membrane protein (TIGR02234 family)